MANAIASLWPGDIAVDLLPPRTILRGQAIQLQKLTHGILEAEVVTTANEKGAVLHVLFITAPLLNRARYEILKVYHGQEFPYPATLEAACFIREHEERNGRQRGVEPPRANLPTKSGLPPAPPALPMGFRSPQATTQQEFTDLVAHVLRSSEVISIIQSLIARSNEEKFKQAEFAEQPPPAAPAPAGAAQ